MFVAGGGCCAACWAIAGKASAIPAVAISASLVRITASGRPLGHIDLDGSRRLLLWNRGQIIKPGGDEQQEDEKYDQSRHGGAFAERESRCIAL